MICLNEVSAEIWKGLQEEKSKVEILERILQKFDASREEADLEEFLQQLRQNDLLDES